MKRDGVPPPVIQCVRSESMNQQSKSVIDSLVAGRKSSDLTAPTTPVADRPEACPPIKELNESSGGISPAKQYGGIRRLPYLAIVLSFAIIDRAFGYEIYSNTTITLWFVGWCLLISLVAVHYRLKNIGYNPDLCFLILVPIVNLFLGIRCLVLQEGYEDTKKLDTAGKILTYIVLTLVIALLIIIGVSKTM